MSPAIYLLLVFLVSVIAAALSGAVGFGGALLLLPLVIRLVGPELGVPLLTIAQIVGNASRAVLGVRVIVWRPLMVFLVLAIPASIVGSYCFVNLPKALLTRIIGVVLLGVVIARWRGHLTVRMTSFRLALSGLVVGFISGLVGSAGPLGAAAFLALDLPPLAYIATEAVAALGMHAAKTVVYRHFVAFDNHAWKLAALLSLGMVVGSWVGKRTVERLDPARFRVVVGALLVAVSLQMIVLG